MVANLHIGYAISIIIDVFPGGMCLCDVIVKLPVGKYYAAGRATKVLRLHVLFLEVSSHVVAALDNFPAH